MNRHTTLMIAGTSQDGGVPQPNCYCINCQQAIDDKNFIRNAASIAIIDQKADEWHIIDMTPDFKQQIINIQESFSLQGKLMKSIFLTHAHIGHYPGLVYLGREAMNTEKLPVFAGAQMKHLLETAPPWRQLTDVGNIDIQTMTDGTKQPINEETFVQAIEVPHRNEFSETFAFWLVGKEKRVLYIPDIDHWDDWDINIEDLCKQADVCIVDGTFFSYDEVSHLGRNFKEIPHPTMTETMNRLQHLTEHTKIYFTHFNHSNPVLQTDSRERKEVEKRGFFIAEENMEIILS